MTPSSLAVRAPAPIARWLAGKSDRERRLVVAVAALVVCALIWLLVWQPMVRDTAALRSAQAANSAALATASRMTQEISALSTKSAAPAASDPRAGLERILAQQKLGGSATQIEWQEGRVRLVFASVDFNALIAVLESLQRDARLRLVEGSLTARVEPGTVRAELTLAR